MSIEHTLGILSYRFIVTKNLDTLMTVKRANDFRIHPRNRAELAWPVRFVMRPRYPRGLMSFPFSGPDPLCTLWQFSVPSVGERERALCYLAVIQGIGSG